MRRKHISDLAMTVLSIVFVAACATEPSRQSTADISNPSISLSPLQRSDYEVTGTVSGSGSVTEDLTTGAISGDTEQYGFVGRMAASGDVQTDQQRFLGIPVGPASVDIASPEGGSAKARGNAAWELIMEARELEADAVIFVTVTEEVATNGNETTYEVEMRGRAIRLITD